MYGTNNFTKTTANLLSNVIKFKKVLAMSAAIFIFMSFSQQGREANISRKLSSKKI